MKRKEVAEDITCSKIIIMFKRRLYTNITILNNKLIHAETPSGARVKCYISPNNSSIYVKEVIEILSQLHIDHLVLVSENITCHVINKLNEKARLYWEVVSFKDICCDKMDHFMVPIYRVLPEQEVLQKEQLFGDRSTFMKMIAKKDAIARYMNFTPGQVVECTSKSTGDQRYRLLIPISEMT